MQKDPEKTVDNFNEYRGAVLPILRAAGVIELRADSRLPELQAIVTTGIQLVNDKITEILGGGNQLTRGDLIFPSVRFVAAEPDRPGIAGYFLPIGNAITLVTDKIADNPRDRTKVFIHEYVHFLSHNGRDHGERVSAQQPLACRNNVGFSRGASLDIREGKEGKLTTDYFRSFNEAVTEQLAIDILPGVHETYSDYRGLLDQVIDDAVTRGFGAKNESGVFMAWSRDQFKHYMYRCFLQGNLEGLTNLLKGVYKGYDISEQQFGLMTNKADLPSVIKAQWKPGGPPPPPAQVVLVLQQRLDAKTPADYPTDINPEPGNGDGKGKGGESVYSGAYEDFIRENEIVPTVRTTIGGREYDIDTSGLVIYRGREAQMILDSIRTEFDSLLKRLSHGKITEAEVSEQVDQLLFVRYRMSMLSDGFEAFYVYKHTRLGS